MVVAGQDNLTFDSKKEITPPFVHSKENQPHLPQVCENNSKKTSPQAHILYTQIQLFLIH